MNGHVDLTEGAAARPLSEDDVATLISGDVRSTFSNATAARVLLRRVRATFSGHAEELRTARRDLTRALEGGKLTSSPLSAAVATLGRLTIEEQRQVFEASTSALVDRMRAAAAAAHAERVAAINATNRSRLVLAAALDDPALDEVTRQRLREHLARLPQLDQPGAAEQISAELAALESPQAPFTVRPTVDNLDALFGN